jgi:hypothetical protein
VQVYSQPPSIPVLSYLPLLQYLTRFASWLEEVPKAKTRSSRFAALAPTTST